MRVRKRKMNYTLCTQGYTNIPVIIWLFFFFFVHMSFNLSFFIMDHFVLYVPNLFVFDIMIFVIVIQDWLLFCFVLSIIKRMTILFKMTKTKKKQNDFLNLISPERRMFLVVFVKKWQQSIGFLVVWMKQMKWFFFLTPIKKRIDQSINQSKKKKLNYYT